MYELTFISQEENDPRVKKMIELVGGKIISEASLGRKKFAYSIGKEQSGCYFTYVFELDPEKIEEINKKIKSENKIIRYLIIQKIIRKLPAQKEIKEAGKTKEIKVPTEEIVVPKTEIKDKKEVAPAKKTAKKAEKEKKPVLKPSVKTKLEKTIKNKEIEITEEERLQALNEKLNELLKE